LKTVPNGDVKLAILDSTGKVIRETNGLKNAGVNRIVWDLRAAAPEGVAGARGPFVLPGKYTVRLSAAGREVTRSVDVEHDPQMPVSDAERRSRFNYLSSINSLQAAALSAANTLTTINDAISALGENLKKTPNTPAAISTAANSIAEKARDVQRRLGAQGGGGGGEEGGGGGGGLRGRINGLFSEIDGSQPAGPQQGTLTGPTVLQTQRMQTASSELNAIVDEINGMITRSMPDLSQQMIRANISVLPPLQPLPKRAPK